MLAALCYATTMATEGERSLERPAPRQRIPADAKKVFEGIIYSAYHWQQQRFDGSLATYERLRRNDSVVIVPVTEEGKIIVARERQPGTDWFSTLPCGGVDAGEEPQVAAERELFEETGYRPADMKLWFAHQVESRVDWAIFVFVARGCKKVAEPAADAGEQLELREVSFDEFLRFVTNDDFQNTNIGPKLLKAVLEPTAMAELKTLFGLPNA